MELLVGNCPTHREKARRMKAISSKLHQHFNVSVAEADRDSDPTRAVLVVATVGRSRREVRETLERVADAVANYPRAQLLSQVITES
jgi:uncharacterized protein YlxP (DUF503 family)